MHVDIELVLGFAAQPTNMPTRSNGAVATPYMKPANGSTFTDEAWR